MLWQRYQVMMVEGRYLHQPRLSWGGAMAEVVEADGHPIDAVAFRKALIAWGREHFRPFPWRLTEDPYHILMAEVMLHRTQAPQVVPVYERFIECYPDVPELASASKEELCDVLYSLGLRWRIDLIQEMTTELIEHFGGQVPRGKADLLSLDRKSVV